MKRFKQIPNFLSYYINAKGFIWSSKSYRYLRFDTNRGYFRVQLCHNNKAYHKYIHRLVLEIFVGPCPEGMEACHNNGDCQDNRLENLRWDTKKNNHRDSIEQGTHSGLLKMKLTKQNIINIIHLWDTKLFKQKEIANMYNVNQSTVNRIINRKIWKHI